MRGVTSGRKLLSQVVTGKLLGFGKIQNNVAKHVVRTCTSNSTVLEHSRLKFDSLLDRATIYHLDQYSGLSPTPISINGALQQASQPTQEESFKYITKEIPVRLANMIMELQSVPRALSRQPQFQQVLFQYIQSFKDLQEFTGSCIFNADTNDKLVSVLKEIKLRHIDTVPVMASAIKGMMADNVGGKMDQKTIQYCMDRLYTNRISIHLLISQYRATHLINKKGSTYSSVMLGTIDPNCDVLDVAREAYADAAFMCDNEYQEHPDLELEGRDATVRETTVKEVRMSYLPNHLHHIFFEIFKNAMRATVENSRKKVMAKMPPVKCLVTKSEGDITIRVTDMGGGISREVVDKVFLYHFTSADIDDKDLLPGAVPLPMHGLGYGIPLSRVYARYFKGDLKMMFMHGLGTDVYIYLKALSDDAKECLPKYSIHAAEKLHKKSSSKVSDWTI